MIQLSAAGKRFGPKLLFENLDWLITSDARVGLVGANGTGKSTLLKILGGIETLDYGSIVSAKNTTFGYLAARRPATLAAAPSSTSACPSSPTCARSNRRWKTSRTTWRNSITNPRIPQVADRYQRILRRISRKDGYALDSQVGTVLDGLGFRKEDWTRYTEEFSGGWQMRIALAKLLLSKPNLLLLDEPTNHLDLETRNWLEQYLLQYPFAYVLISHDRYFLDVTVDRIIEIWNKGVHFYSGNYEKYLAQKQERRDSLVAAYKNQRERIEQLEAFINRFRYQATKAKQVQSRIKELEKIERIEVPPDEKTIHFSFPQPNPSGRLVVECHGVAKSYGPKEVFRDANFTIQRGDRIALVGVNGAGKSTLIKLLTGIEPLTEGKLNLGHNVEPDYFAQDQYKELDPASRMLDDLSDVAPQKSITELRGVLGCFLFSEDDVFKPIGVLSGGERNRYALARMLLHPVEFSPARRAHQPPRYARQRRAAGVAGEVQRHRRLRLARSLLHRQAGHAHLRDRQRPRRGLSRQLRRLSVAQAASGVRRSRAAGLDSHIVRCPRIRRAEVAAEEAHQSHQAEAAANSSRRDRAEHSATGRRHRRM